VHLIKPARSSALLEALVSTIQKHRNADALAHVMEPDQVEVASVKENASQEERQALNLVRLPTSSEQIHRIDILVAEDNEVNQLVFSQILGETGLTFEIVGNGRLAVEACKRLNPRMILMDVSMPEMNGLEATGKIRDLEPLMGRHVPIVGVTAHALKGDRERCIDAGMDDYLSKPISPKALTQKISLWVKSPDEVGKARA
jgi:CheY-like chemotaxis protein